MSIEKVDEILTKAEVFYLSTVDGEKPKVRPLGFHLMSNINTQTFFKRAEYQYTLKFQSLLCINHQYSNHEHHHVQ